MTLPVATKNSMLDGLTFTHASLHTAFPGSVGSNEVVGGAYARKAITINAASGGIRSLNAAVTFDVPATTVRWVGFWSNSTFIGCTPNGGATPKNFIAIASTDLIYSPSHGLVDGQKIAFFQGTPPPSLAEGAIYFLRDASTDSFRVAATLGGAALDIIGNASFGCVVGAIVEDVYAIAATHQLVSSSVAVPD